MSKLIAIAALVAALTAPAYAWVTYGNPQGYQGGGFYRAPSPTINTYPNGLGGYRIEQPGAPTINTYPNGLGGFRVNGGAGPSMNCVPNGLGGMRCF